MKDNYKDGFVNFLKTLNDNKELCEAFSKMENIEESYEFAKVYLGDVSFDEYKEKISKLSTVLSNKNVLSSEDLDRIAAGRSHLDKTFFSEVFDLCIQSKEVLKLISMLRNKF